MAANRPALLGLHAGRWPALYHRRDLITYRPVVDAPQSKRSPCPWPEEANHRDLVEDFIGICSSGACTVNSTRGRYMAAQPEA
ncbi:hypothetical protein GCM10017687_79670 [Streptomyces echinatus]|uniref:hypothetical protein n=1 Tax=Streptomyces echinatus TaxID=67293 RepID=UPI0031ECBD71